MTITYTTKVLKALAKGAEKLFGKLSDNVEAKSSCLKYCSKFALCFMAIAFSLCYRFGAVN